MVVSDIVAESGRETVRLIDEAGGKGYFIEGDVSVSADAQTIVQAAVSSTAG